MLENLEISSSPLEFLEALESLKRRGLIEIQRGSIIQKPFIKNYTQYLLLEQVRPQKNYSQDLPHDSQDLIQRVLHNEKFILDI